MAAAIITTTNHSAERVSVDSAGGGRQLGKCACGGVLRDIISARCVV